MKLKFKTQDYQTAAVQAVVDCFKGQVPTHGGIRYRMDPDAQKLHECARKSFAEINRKHAPEDVKYDVVNGFGKLMELVK